MKLWEHQVAAIQAVEAALTEDQRSLLLSMATGTGKTKTAIALCYRLLKTKRFRRILFLVDLLVDRTALGEQTEGDNICAPLSQVSEMQPVVDPSIPFTQLVDELETMTDPAIVEAVVDQLIAKLQRKKKHLSDASRDQIEALAGMPVEDMVDLVIRPGDIVFNPIRFSIGSIARYRGTEPALVSPEYQVF